MGEHGAPGGERATRGGAWRRLPLVLLLVWAAWSGGAAVLSLVSRIGSVSPSYLLSSLTATEEDFVTRALLAWDRDRGRTPGYHGELLRTLREHLPPDAVLLTDRTPGRLAGRELPVLETLMAPVTFHVVEEPAGFVRGADEAWVLDREDRQRELLEPRRELLAQGPDWKLWR